jgi:MarR family transcriptional regulator, organic hydroperoxide resistance regulator
VTKPSNVSADYPLSPALDFLQRLWQLNHALERLSSRMEKQLGVTAQQRLIIRCVGKFPGMTAGQLATMLRVDPGTVSASLKRLEDKGLLDRHSDPRDGRRTLLGLTGKGRKLDGPAKGTVEGVVDQLLSSVSSEDIATGLNLLEQLAALLQDELRS